MANTIKLGYSNTSGQSPDTLAGGEVGINTSNRKVWVGNGTGNTLVFNHADYAPASANASETYVNAQGFITAVAGSSFFAPASANASETYVTTQINNLIAAAPGALNTLNELAASIGDDANYATTVTNALAGKAAASGNATQSWVSSNFNNYSFPYSITSASTGGTVAYRDSSGDLTARLFRSEYDTVATASSIGYINVQYNTAADNYIRPATAASVRTFLNVANGATNTAAPHYTSAIAEGDHGLTQANFTDTLRTKLDGITAGANAYSFPYTVSASAGNNTVVQRNSSGYIFSSYFNGNGTFATSGNGSGMGLFTGTNGSDTYGRSYTAAAARSLLNVASGANNYSHPTGAGNNHIPSGGAANKFLKWSSSGVATWEYDNTGVFSITAGYGLGGGTINNIGTITHSIANGFSHIPPNGSTGYFLQYSAAGVAAWVSGAIIAEAARTDMGVAPGPSGTPGLTDVNFTSTLKTKLDAIAPNATNTAAPHYTSAIAVGAGGLTQQNFTTTLKNKLDGITAGATVNTNLTDTQVRSKFTGGVGIAMDSSGVLSTALHELADHTPSMFPPTDEFIILANGSQKRKLATEIFGTHCFAAVNTSTSSTSTTQSASASAVKAAYDLAASNTYTLPAAATSTRGGVKLGYTPTATVEHAVQATAGGQLYVVVNNHTTTWNALENISNLTVLP